MLAQANQHTQRTRTVCWADICAIKDSDEAVDTEALRH